MESRYKLYDAEEKGLFIGVCNHYFKVTDAKEVYNKAKSTGDKDDSLLMIIKRDSNEEAEENISFGVEEGEQFALTILNICNAIKR
ncbi:hypothetical protein [Pseudalkalibacillus hwajinpoensis]|uniref:hypothetical protein n=1 Tax=Guptibacillus hwajinpoensis TaxID=208199 RepID=UPI001CD64F53|nr:hypothetical protein [Pseudalkalibacillus hwajinpoensis]MCA0992965.1 hypothetical protein [Pseudalkalibacillus hwajinpoensis]